MPGILLCFITHQEHRGVPWLGVLLCRSVHQALDEPSLSIVQQLMLVCGEREAMVMAPALTHDSAVSPASMAAWLSSTGNALHSLLPQVPLVPLSAANSSPCPKIASQSLCSSSQGTCVPVRGMYGSGKDCLILIPFRLPQVSCFTLSLKYFSSDSDNCPDVGIGPWLQFPHPLRAGPDLLTLLFFP